MTIDSIQNLCTLAATVAWVTCPRNNDQLRHSIPSESVPGTWLQVRSHWTWEF